MKTKEETQTSRDARERTRLDQLDDEESRIESDDDDIETFFDEGDAAPGDRRRDPLRH